MIVFAAEDVEDQIEAARDEETESEKDEDVIEIDFDEAEKEVQSPWIAIARFYSNKRFSVRGLFEDMAKVWGLRQKMEHKVLKGSLFLIEFNCDGDFNFALAV